MNYHIIPQDKFFEAYIEDIYRIHQEDNNTFLIRGERGDSPYFHTSRPVVYLGKESDTYIDYLQRITPEDKLFVSWYDSFIGSMILRAKLSSSLYVYLMGADFYAQPEWWHEEWLLDPLTKRKIKKERLYPTYLPFLKPWRWYRWLDFKRRLRLLYSEKLETIRRIDYLILPEHATGEVDLVRSLYPGSTFEHRVGTFDQNYDLSKDYPLKSIPDEGASLSFLLGNSSDLAGNQMDAIHYLKNKVQYHFDVYCPLSYGDREACNWIGSFGAKELGERFHPITSFMDRKSYVDFLNEMDLVIMYHNRQQAVGTIMTSLALGKPVFLKRQSPFYNQLKCMGVKPVYDVNSIHRVDLLQTIRDAQEVRTDTLAKIGMEYSDSSRITSLKRLLG